jgi:uncharacterized membrane protein (UPF0127 family)
VIKTAIIAIVASITAGIGIIATAALYFYPAISGILGASDEDNNQQEFVGSRAIPTDGISSGYRQVNVTVNGVELVADIAATNEQRTKGLSVKDALAENEAMLFVFDIAQEHSFWMKDMKFPIDIIWLDSNKTVVRIENSLQPCSFDSFCPTYRPDNDALYVLETAAGFAQKHAIAKGTRIEFELTAYNDDR